jgi:diguanylate cyclase (GGDEF)-like protein
VDGAHAWEILNTGPAFSLVVSDLTMPKLDGFGLLERIRNSLEPDISDIPVIIITGANDSESTMQRARETGATDFIGKPFDSVHLLARTQAHASAYASRRSMTTHALTLEDQALIDTQTGLANEAAFMDRGYQQLSYAIRHNSKLAIAYIEIDHFGELFRQHGKNAADMIIKYVATVLETGIRHEDMAARIGAARFAMLLPGMDQNGIHRLTDRITNDIRKRTVKCGNSQIRFSVSIGIAATPIRQDTRLEMLLSAAGSSLRDAVAAGGNRVVTCETGETGQPSSSGVTRIVDRLHPAPPAIAEIITDPIMYKVIGTPPDETGVLNPARTSRPDACPVHAPEVIGEPAVTGLNQASTISEKPAAPENVQLDTDQDEEILITSPYSLFDDTPGTVTLAEISRVQHCTVEIPSPAAQPDAGSVPATTLQPDTAEHTEVCIQESTDSPEVIPSEPRNGLFRRLLALFPRFRK